MTVITARPWWFKESIGTFTTIHTTRRNLVNLRVLVTAPMRHQVERITLENSMWSTLCTDARRPIMPRRSGGLENIKSFQQTEQTPFTHQKDRTLYLDTKDFKLCTFRKHEDICSSLPSLKRVNKPTKKYFSRRGNRDSTQTIFLQFSRETFSVILKRTVYNSGISQALHAWHHGKKRC